MGLGMELTTEKNATGATEVSGVGTVARTGWMSHTAELRTTSGATCEAQGLFRRDGWVRFDTVELPAHPGETIEVFRFDLT